MPDNATFFNDFVPYEQPPVSCVRDLPLPKRRSKDIRWEKSAKYKPSKQKKRKEKAKLVPTTIDAIIPSTSSSIDSQSVSCITDMCQTNSATVGSLDKDDAMLVAALLAFDPSIALALDMEDV